MLEAEPPRLQHHRRGPFVHVLSRQYAGVHGQQSRHEPHGSCLRPHLERRGGRVNIAAPGLVNTELTNFNPNGVTVEEGARRIVGLAALGEAGPSSTFSDINGPLP
ncbi:short-chain dehydrogenase/reductase SDR [Gaeumannomyces tritici R3-111a-1]|uniref:Short-chain dehydrogenase/reductase SDR n=1 Tax=Gaeumannomyces tritici (strain R3-111a-1) TaxID=644352 RepID=J3PA51_GAET3|nr:short-chain dehydrogenase/reductase SDR [Gaeumannomyces tritici R3-111a-1]EJT71117.1 short-chain dehydrogenase/reductase SDR [Gaeumannomyces tritici R3-111a-1]